LSEIENVTLERRIVTPQVIAKRNTNTNIKIKLNHVSNKTSCTTYSHTNPLEINTDVTNSHPAQLQTTKSPKPKIAGKPANSLKVRFSSSAGIIELRQPNLILTDIVKDTIQFLPPLALHTQAQITIVDDVNSVSTWVSRLRSIIQSESKFREHKVLGFDTETKPQFTKGATANIIALIQLATTSVVVLFRLSKFPALEIPSELLDLLSDENILKVGVGVRSDVKAIQSRNPAFHDNNSFFDLTEPYNVCFPELKRLGLRNLTASILSMNLSKKAQLSNWEVNRMSKTMITYASNDALVGIKLFNILIHNIPLNDTLPPKVKREILGKTKRNHDSFDPKVHNHITTIRHEDRTCVEHIPRIPIDQEHLLSAIAQQQLHYARNIAQSMGIPKNQIWVHMHLLQIWYNSFDVGRVISRTIPMAASSGFPRIDEFTTPELEIHAEQSPFISTTGVEGGGIGPTGWEALIHDLEQHTKDRTILNNIRCGSPQSYMGRFCSTIHPNMKMPEQIKQKVRDNIKSEYEAGRTSKLLNLEELPPVVKSSPTGAVPKNSAEKNKLLVNNNLTLADVKNRIILNVSKKDKEGNSINSCTSYNTLHKVKFISTKVVEKQTVLAHERLLELGFSSSVGRILLWKADIKAAYRLMLMAAADYFLGVHSIDDKFVIEYTQQFGQRSSVTIFSRFVYALTTLMSTDDWYSKDYPEMALDIERLEQYPHERPPAHTILEALKKFRSGDSAKEGCIDPRLFLFVGWFLDDFHGLTIDVRDDISTPLNKDKDGIANPIGKALNKMLIKYGIPQHIIKRMEENGPNLMGSQDPIVLGLHFNLATRRIYARSDYANSLAIRMESWNENTHRAHKAEEWGLIQGRLSFVLEVYPMIRAFMREIWETYAVILDREAAAWRASDVVLENMLIIAKILHTNFGRPMFKNNAWLTDYQRGLQFCYKIGGVDDIMHDSSTRHGFGFFNKNKRTLYCRLWNEQERQLASNKKIFILEAVGLFITFYINKRYLMNSKINMIGDNEKLVQAFHKCGSKNHIVNNIVRAMILILSNVGIQINLDRDKFDVSLCSSEENGGADALSHDNLEAFEAFAHNQLEGASFTRLSSDDPIVQEAEAEWNKILHNHLSKKK